MVFRRRAALVAPEKKPYIVQADGWVQNVYFKAGDTVRLSDVAARYLVLHGVVKDKDAHEAAAAAKEAAPASEATEGAEEHEAGASEAATAPAAHA